jgi:hypothetical protein
MTLTYTATDVLTGLLVLVTAFYAWVTFRILRANEAVVRVMGQQVEALHRPYVRVAALARTGTQLLELSIKNIGRTPANDLRLTLSRDFYQSGEATPARNMRGFAAFSQPIGSLPPDAELRFVLGVGSKILSSGADQALTPHVFDVTASYRFDQLEVTEKTIVDLRPFGSSLILHDPVADEIAKLREVITKKNGL